MAPVELLEPAHDLVRDLLGGSRKADPLVHVARPLERAHAHHVALRALRPGEAALERELAPCLVPDLLAVDQHAVHVEDDGLDPPRLSHAPIIGARPARRFWSAISTSCSAGRRGAATSRSDFACSSEFLVEGDGRSLPHDVGRDARPDHRRSILLAVTGGARRAVRTVRVEAVAEAPRRLVREEAVLALPALPVGGVERVDVDVAAPGVQRAAVAR